MIAAISEVFTVMIFSSVDPVFKSNSVKLAWGSKSIAKTLKPFFANAQLSNAVLLVLPTPPLKFAILNTVAIKYRPLFR